MWLVDWLIARWARVYEIFESWYWRIRDAVSTYWAQFWYVVVVWYGKAHRYFSEKVNQLEDVVVWWYGRIRAVIYDYWTRLWQALTATWGFIWDHFYQGYKEIIDYTYSARVDIKDTFTRFKGEFAAFRDNPGQYIYDRIPLWIKQIWWNSLTWWDWLNRRWDDFTTQIGLFLDNPSQYIYDRIPQWAKDIWSNANTWWQWLQGRWDAFTTQVGLFIDDPAGYIYDHIPEWIKQLWWNAQTWWDWLNLRWDDFTREIGYFIDDPYGYLTSKLQAWIEGWRDYIFGVIGDLLDQLTREIILYLLDWMGYVAPPIEALDEIGPHFSPFTDWLDEIAEAWKELKEAWVMEAMAMMEAFAAELKGEEEMKLLTPSEIIFQYWYMLTPEQIKLIVEPPIKG